MNGFTRHGAATFNSLIASGGDSGGQGPLSFILIILILVVIVSIIGGFQQPTVIVLQDPFKFLMKIITFAVVVTVILATIAVILLTSG